MNVVANLAYVAIQFPILDGQRVFTGRLGREMNTEQGYRAMELCALNVLAQMNRAVGFEKSWGLISLTATTRRWMAGKMPLR